ncbi:MAG: tyrosine-type recombinase/integrase [Solirubrobacterales bacterium]
MLVRRGKGGRRREVGMDEWGGSSFGRGSSIEPGCRADRCFESSPGRRRAGPGRRRRCEPSSVVSRARLGVRRRFAPHQLRHAHAVEMAREGVALNVIQRQLGHADLGITSAYLQGIDSGEIVDVVHARRAPVVPATTALAP